MTLPAAMYVAGEPLLLNSMEGTELDIYTLFELLLLLSLLSVAMLSFGSTRAVLASVPLAVGVTVRVTVKVPPAASSVTLPPLAEQVNSRVSMAQDRLPLPPMPDWPLGPDRT